MFLDVFPLNIHVSGRMFQADRVAGAVTNVHGELAVLCSPAGIWNLVFLGAAGVLVASVTHGGLEGVLLGTAHSSSGLESLRGAAAALPPLLSVRFCGFCSCARFENANEALKAAQRLKYVFLAAVLASFGCGTSVGRRETPSPEQH